MIVKALRKIWEKLPGPDKTLACKLFGEQRWRMKLATFHKNVKPTTLKKKMATEMQ